MAQAKNEDEVVLLEDDRGNIYAIPIYRLEDAKIKKKEPKAQDSIRNLTASNLKVIGTSNMPRETRQAVYVKPIATPSLSIAVEAGTA